jgi:hypothetical protein
MMTTTFSGEPGKPDLTLFEDLGPAEPEDDVSPFEELEAATAGDPRIQEYQGGRIMPHPLTGKPTKFPRASGFALADETILGYWRMACAVLGTAKNRDLYALANAEPMPKGPFALWPRYWWKHWKEVGELALDRVGNMAGAHEGTAFHSWREQIEAGEITVDDVPEEWRPHIDRFQQMHTASAMSVVPEYVEVLVVNLKLHNGVCGRLDNLRRLPDGRLVLDDTKTGKQAPKGLDEMGIQFSIYANAEWWWMPDHPLANEHGYVRAPIEIRKDVATVSWVPIDAPENGRIIPIDIEWGWRAAQVCAWLKGYWNRAKRKNNGLELPLSALWNEDMATDHRSSTMDYTQRITACTTAEELSSIWLEICANVADVNTPKLQKLYRLGEARKASIKAAR